jgi:hypothetical protein
MPASKVVKFVVRRGVGGEVGKSISATQLRVDVLKFSFSFQNFHSKLKTNVEGDLAQALQ